MNVHFVKNNVTKPKSVKDLSRKNQIHFLQHSLIESTGENERAVGPDYFRRHIFA